MNTKILKVNYRNKDGLHLFKEYPAPEDADSIYEVELVEHRENDKTLDVCKGTKG